ncbi:MAG: hypothetical protein ACRD12_11855 [Acidimicrobiales bacterium]
MLLARTRLRPSWRAALVLVCLIGLGGGVTLAVAAGARRNPSANVAILRAASASTVLWQSGAVLSVALIVTVAVVQGATLVPATLAGRTPPGQTRHAE